MVVRAESWRAAAEEAKRRGADFVISVRKVSLAWLWVVPGMVAGVLLLAELIFKSSLLIKTEVWYNAGVRDDNEFWKVCEALDCEQRVELLRYLMAVEDAEFPCVNELAERFGVSSAAMSVHLKKLSNVGLVSSKRADRRVYYRAFPTTEEGERVLAALRGYFAASPDDERRRDLAIYIHALSHGRRHAIVRCLAKSPGLEIRELSVRTDMPPATVDRLFGELNKAHIVDLNSRVVRPDIEPEATLLNLTLR